MPTLQVIVGATGAGKTAYSIGLAQQYACPIVSADSRQIYRDLPIGTAAPTHEQLQQVQHYFVGCKALTDTYSAGQYARDCTRLLAELFKQYDTVVMVGGSMLYVDAVCTGIDDIPQVPAKVRSEVQTAYREHGLAWLQGEVERLDPAYWQEVDRQNPQRLMHCVEVCRTAGSPYSLFRRKGQTQSAEERPFRVRYTLIEREREELYARINRRVDAMIAQGLVAEAQRAFEQLGVPLSPSADLQAEVLPNSVNTVGYKELLRYLRGEWSLDKAVEMIKQNTRHYAKRQMTWWRNKQPLE